MSENLRSYTNFLETKRHKYPNQGFDTLWIPNKAFDFQQEIINRSLIKGRFGIFADTGLGKTLIQLVIAQNVVMKTNGNVLILTPLAVAFQFLKEAESLGIDDICHTKDGKFDKKIVVCNYERLHYLDHNDFECVILDESSILKNFDGKIKGKITSFIKKVPYRFLSTATPSPNDFIELGTSSEALGYMGYMDMLSKFFKNNQNTSDSRNSKNIGEKFYLKPHAEKDFFSWVNQWSIMCKKPSDLGFNDDRYKLPSLTTNHHTVVNESMELANGQLCLIKQQAKRMTEVRNEQKQTVSERCELAYEIAKNKTSVYWCNRNDESSLLKELDSDATEIKGSMSIDKKEQILIDFANGDIERIITKPKMTSFGLNWQHCNHTVIFPTWSYEQYYQIIRRFWRFGQKKNVNADIVISDGMERVITAIEQKAEKSRILYENLVDSVNSVYQDETSKSYSTATLPEFI